MKWRNLMCPVIGGVLCALVAASAGAEQHARGAPVRVYDATELTPDRYTVIKRLWTEPWRSALWVHSHSDSGAAIAALTSEAARLGADAVTNLVCLNDQRAWFDRGYFCYGLAVKLK